MHTRIRRIAVAAAAPVLATLAVLAADLPARPASAGSVTTLLQMHGDDGTFVVGPLVAYNGSIIGAGQSSSTVSLFQKPAKGGAPWVNTVIHRFTGLAGDGAYPSGGLTMSGGVVFGTTSGGGNAGCANGCGTVFELTAPATPGGDWGETQLLAMSNDNNGYAPSGAPLVRTANTVYATAIHAANDTVRPGSSSGPVGGVVFRLTRPVGGKGAWTQTVLHHFDAASLDGDTPFGGLTAGPGGVIYGTTFGGGKCGQGTVYQLTPPAKPTGAWKETLLHEFGATATGCDYQDGELPVAGVTLAGGTLYGTTRGGTSNECGTAFAIATGSTPTYRKIYVFGQGASDACSPQGPVRVDADGTIFGTTAFGGGAPVSTECPHGCGTIFALSPQAGGASYAARVIYAFKGGTDGSEPRSGLIGSLATALIGAASHGGFATDTANPDWTSFGTLFRVKP